MLQYFLGNTVEEAEANHNKFFNTINTISRNYSLSTGIDKKDLYSEALFGLADALEKYNSDSNMSLNNFVIFKIKDKLNQYVRDTATCIKIPQYVHRSIKIVNKLRQILEDYGYVNIPTLELLSYNLYDTSIPYSTIVKYELYISSLNKIALRANTTVEKLLSRVEFIPVDFVSEECVVSNPEEILFYNYIESTLTDVELSIVKQLLDKKTKTEIALHFNKSIKWVSSRIESIRNKLEN